MKQWRGEGIIWRRELLIECGMDDVKDVAQRRKKVMHIYLPFCPPRKFRDVFVQMIVKLQ